MQRMFCQPQVGAAGDRHAESFFICRRTIKEEEKVMRIEATSRAAAQHIYFLLRVPRGWWATLVIHSADNIRMSTVIFSLSGRRLWNIRYSDDMPKVANLKETLHGPTTKQVIYWHFSILGAALQLCCFPAVLLVLMLSCMRKHTYIGRSLF